MTGDQTQPHTHTNVREGFPVSPWQLTQGASQTQVLVIRGSECKEYFLYDHTLTAWSDRERRLRTAPQSVAVATVPLTYTSQYALAPQTQTLDHVKWAG